MKNNIVRSMDKKQYVGIDVAKLIFSILIVCLHLNMGNKYFLQGVCRIATPMFFCISGYFSSKKVLVESKFSEIVPTIIRLVKIYFFYSILYIPIALKWNWYSLDFMSIVKAIIYRGTFIQLWFFPALIESIIIIFILRKILKNDLLVGIVPAMLYIYAICSFEYKWLPTLTTDINNVLFHGMFYYWLGNIIYGKELLLSKKMIKCCFLTFGIVYFIELNLLLKTNITITASFSLIGLVFFLMMNLVNFNIKLDKKWSLRLRNTSTVIFGTHYIFYFILELAGADISLWYMKIVVLLVCVICSFLLVVMSKKWKILEIFY